jgi:hypothetical protein
MTLEFDCPDCLWHVVQFDGRELVTCEKGRRCFTCGWIAEQPEADRPRLREMLMEPPPDR